MTTHWCSRANLGAAVLGICGCGSAVQAGVEPRDAYDSAYEIEHKATRARADLKGCSKDKAKCADVDHALAEIVRTSRSLESAAMEAGYKPDVSSPTPSTP